MPRWTCPNCEREFGAANQAHVCAPGISVEELLSRHPAWDGKIAEFRPRVRSVLLSICLPSPRDHPRVMRIYSSAPDRHWHPVKLARAEEVDEQIRAWLQESYDINTD